MSAPPTAAPSGVVTFLLTDIEGSTGRWETDADLMRKALAALALMLSGLEAEHGDRMAACDYFTVAVRNHHESGNTAMMGYPLAVLAAFLDRLGRYEPAATIAGFAISPHTASALPEISTTIAHLRDVLGTQAYESLAQKGEAMTMAAVATYAYNQIDQARAELNAVSK